MKLSVKGNISNIYLFTVVFNVFKILSAQGYETNGEFTSSTIDFAFNTYRKIESNPNKNVFISPASLFIDLTLVLAGAKENTAEQMKNAMALKSIDNRVIYEQVGELIAQMNKINPAYILNTANKVYVEKTLSLLPDYTKIIQNNFNGSFEKVDFSQNIKLAMDIINNWVKQQTQGKIPSIVSDLDGDTKLVLVNALYFKAKWQLTFNKTNTKKDSFTTASGEIVQTDMMIMKNPIKSFNYTNDEVLGCEILELPYSGQTMSMYILLPRKNINLNTLENQLNAKTINDALDNKKLTAMSEIRIPKIHLEKSYKFNDALTELGIKDLFTNAADLSAMTGHNNLKADSVLQKTYLDVNEEGTEAAAATATIIMTKSSIVRPPQKVPFLATRPFTFFIRNNVNGQIIFLGRFSTPEK